MSRKLSDFYKYMKPFQLGGKQVTLTVSHVGAIPLKSREREFTVAGEAPKEAPTDLQLVLHFRETQAKPLRLNDTNMTFLRTHLGVDLDAIVDSKITLRPVTLSGFGGTESIEIVAVEKQSAQTDKKPLINDRGRLIYLTNQQVTLAKKKGFEAVVPSKEDIAGMTDEQVAAAIAKAESNIMDLQAA